MLATGLRSSNAGSDSFSSGYHHSINSSSLNNTINSSSNSSSSNSSNNQTYRIPAEDRDNVDEKDSYMDSNQKCNGVFNKFFPQHIVQNGNDVNFIYEDMLNNMEVGQILPISDEFMLEKVSNHKTTYMHFLTYSF